MPVKLNRMLHLEFSGGDSPAYRHPICRIVRSSSHLPNGYSDALLSCTAELRREQRQDNLKMLSSKQSIQFGWKSSENCHLNHYFNNFLGLQPTFNCHCMVSHLFYDEQVPAVGQRQILRAAQPRIIPNQDPIPFHLF